MTKIRKAFGQSPELVIEAGKATAIANAFRFDVGGTAVYIRVDKTVSGAIMLNGKLYHGANGCAGDFSWMTADKEIFASQVTELCRLLDPELIHIAWDREINFDLQIAHESNTQIIIETSDNCRDAFYGAALMLREKWVRSKME